MNRSGYSDCLDQQDLAMYRGQVASAIRGKRGQAFLKELAAAMDAMPDKVLIADELVDGDGCCCALGVICLSRGLDVKAIDYEDPQSIGDALGIARQLAAEIEFENDEPFYCTEEDPAARWDRMRRWVDNHIKPA